MEHFFFVTKPEDQDHIEISTEVDYLEAGTDDLAFSNC
jgi:hypothetical protein